MYLLNSNASVCGLSTYQYTIPKMPIHDDVTSVQEEGIELSIHFDGDRGGDGGELEDSTDEAPGNYLGSHDLAQLCAGEKKKNERATPKNADPIEQPMSRIVYEKRVPRPSTGIAMISYKRLDRITAEHAKRSDACLICARDITSQTDISLYELPCHHTWCKECLARAFHFVLGQHAFGRLQCCTAEDIPLKYFDNIMEKRFHSPVETGSPPNPTNTAEAEDLDRPWDSTEIIEHVEKDQGIFISPGDMALYRAVLEEHQISCREKLYCYGRACGQYVPKDCRNKTMGKCPHCSRRTCLRCRRDARTHGTDLRGKCMASKKNVDSAKNEAKTFSLAKRKGWKRCPRCRMFVQKIRGGCSSVVCRCGRLFFYG